MRARATQLLLALAAAALGGCMAMEAGGLRPYGPRPSATRRDIATFEEAVALAANLEYDAAAPKFQEVLPRFDAAGDSARAAEAMFWLGFCREKQGRLAEARDLYRRLIRKYRRQRPAEQARRRLEALGATP